MERKYKPLFNLTVVHNYYESGRANDFAFSPTAKTAKDLSRYKLLARLKNDKPGSPEAYGLKMNYLHVGEVIVSGIITEAGTPLIPITASENPSLVFGVNLMNDRFLNFTDKPKPSGSTEVFHYTNVGANPAVDDKIQLVKSTVRLRRKSFEYDFSLTGSFPITATIKIFDSANVEQAEYGQTLISDDGEFQSLINLTGLDDGIYNVEILDGATSIETITYYISDELTAMNPLGILDIVLTDNTSISSDELELTFTARNVPFKYFVVFNEPVTGEEVTKASPIITFAKISLPALGRDEDLATVNSLKLRYPDATVFLFESSTSIDLSETPIKDIKLKKAAGTATEAVLVKHLPGMPIENTKAEAYIFI